MNRLTSDMINSCTRTTQEEAALPRLTSVETENEGFASDLRRPHRPESNESFDSVKVGHHNRAWIRYRATREEDWLGNAHVDDANDDGRCTGARFDVRTTNHSIHT